MKKYIFLFLSLCLLSCKGGVGDKKLPTSFGNYNNVLVVIDDKLWIGETGDSIRHHLAAYIEDVDPVEAQFTIKQFSPKLFNTSYKKYRNIIVLSDNHNNSSFSHEVNKFASPQNYFVLTAKNKGDLMALYCDNSDSINKSVHQTEIAHYIDELRKEPLHNKEILSRPFDIELDLPKSYRLIERDNNFIWFKKDIASGSSSILVYSVSIESIRRDKQYLLTDIIRVKDSVNGKYIQSSEDGSYLYTSEEYSPNYEEVYLNGMSGVVFRGTWDMVNSFMTGPYLTFVFKDEELDKYVFVEGLVYNPSMNKRVMLTEIESIIKTIVFK
ncbi:DUF4837 family protein [Myroides pelagicus]|uniref:DUF4837 family protein n=1 Tax=Myroides pelagicus TaxID=270914 RepID=A0A7K1GP40_9FLAO|nr:DUF4837 family protein [Myroides pelagicus]MEC4113309.1 DUF4837 family protein [Myroides pelagicus]MTH30520.1 DUF4837 family protein [Myroides pelagicus]